MARWLGEVGIGYRRSATGARPSSLGARGARTVLCEDGVLVYPPDAPEKV